MSMTAHENKDPKLMHYKNGVFLNLLKIFCSIKKPKILILGFYDSDFIKKLQQLNPYLAIVEQEHYISKEQLFGKKSYYDIIISRELIEHVHDQNKLVALWHQLLKKQGIVIIETPNVHTWYSRLMFLCTDYLSFFHGKYIAKYDHKHPVFTWSLQQLVKDRFAIEKLEFNFGILPLLRIRFNTKRKLLGDSMNVVLRKL